jgi:hypothetical protein
MIIFESRAMGADISTDVQRDAAVKNATTAWVARMSRNGYHVIDPNTPLCYDVL